MVEEMKNRKLRFGELFRESWKLFWSNTKGIFAVALIIGVPCCILLNLLLDKIIILSDSINNMLLIPGAESMFYEGTSLFQQTRSLLVLFFALICVRVYVVPLATVAVAKMTEVGLHEERPSISKCLLYALEKGPSIILAGTLYMGLLFCGFALFVVPIIFIELYFCFYIYSLSLGNKSAFACFKGSFSVVRGHAWITLGYLFFWSVLNVLFNLTLNILFPIDASNILMNVVLSSVLFLFNMISTVFLTLVFLNRTYFQEEKSFMDQWKAGGYQQKIVLPIKESEDTNSEEEKKDVVVPDIEETKGTELDEELFLEKEDREKE